MSSKRYAIWYEPTGDIHHELRETIAHWADKYHSPIFDPHINLLPGGCALSQQQVVEKLSQLIKKSETFTTTLLQLDKPPEFFRSIFIAVQPSRELLSFANQIQQEVNGCVAENYFPHLSLFYGDLPDAEKDLLISSVGKDYKKSFVLDKVDVIEYELNQPPETWKKVASIKIG